MGKITAFIKVTNDETGGPLGNVEVELVGVANQLTGTDGVARFDVTDGEAYDLKVRHDALRPTYKDSGEFWLTEFVTTAPGDQRARYKQLPGQTGVWGIIFTASDSTYDVRMRRQLRHAGTVSAKPGGKVVFDRAAPETIIIAGTNVHDDTYGNKMMFLAQAVGAIRKRYSRDAYLSLLVFTDGYTSGEIAEVKQRALSYNGSTVFVPLGSKQELVNYLNTRTTDASYDYRANERILIAEIRIFSHGVPGKLAFGLDLPDPRPSELDFVIADVASIKPDAFNPGAELSSFACRTGNSSWANQFSDDWRKESKPEDSLAQKLAEQLGITVRGFITRSDYKPTYADQPHSYWPSEDPAYHADFVDLDDPGAQDPKGKRNGKVVWNRRGAYLDPVSKENSPPGLTTQNGAVGVWIFQKGKAPRKE